MMGKHPHHPMAVPIAGRELRQALIAILTPKTARKGYHFQHSNVHFDYNHDVNDEYKTWHQKTCTFAAEITIHFLIS